ASRDTHGRVGTAQRQALAGQVQTAQADGRTSGSGSMQTVNFKAGDTIIAEGDRGDTAYLIVSGSVEVIVGRGAKGRDAATLHAREVFGEMCLIEPGPRSATVKARMDTTCATTSYKEFVDSIQTNPAQAIQFMRTLVHRLRQMDAMFVA